MPTKFPMMNEGKIAVQPQHHNSKQKRNFESEAVDIENFANCSLFQDYFLQALNWLGDNVERKIKKKKKSVRNLLKTFKIAKSCWRWWGNIVVYSSIPCMVEVNVIKRHKIELIKKMCRSGQ